MYADKMLLRSKTYKTYHLFPECSLPMLEEERAILPKEAGQPDEDGFAAIPLDQQVAKVKFPKPSQVTSLRVRATSGLSAEDVATVSVTFLKTDGKKNTTVSFHQKPIVIFYIPPS